MIMLRGFPGWRCMVTNILVDKQRLAAYCRQYHIRSLSLFGSVLRADFDTGSDIDVLVEFEPGHEPGLIGVARMERELSEVFDNRAVDLRTAQDLSRYFRQDVLNEAEVQYPEG